jgi:hypothetical protein
VQVNLPLPPSLTSSKSIQSFNQSVNHYTNTNPPECAEGCC